MSTRKKKKHTSGRKPVQIPPKKRIPIILISLVMVVAVGAAILVTASLRSNGQKQSDAAVPQALSNPTLNKDQIFKKLIGRWLRPDGGYIIEIRSIKADGRLDAAYLNPRSINVARGEASWQNGHPQVFIELQDTGYPGSTYTLDYDLNQDILTGIYYQAALKQAFEVEFVRQD